MTNDHSYYISAIVEEGSDVSEDEEENVPRPKKRKLDESHVSESIQTINNQRIKYFQSDGQLPGDGENVIAYKYSKQPVKRNPGKPKGRAIKIRALQEKHRDEVSALKVCTSFRNSFSKKREKLTLPFHVKLMLVTCFI